MDEGGGREGEGGGRVDEGGGGLMREKEECEIRERGV